MQESIELQPTQPLLNSYKKPAFNVYNQEKTFISLDKAFEYVGDNSKYQRKAIIILSLQWVCHSFITMGFPFLLYTKNYRCFPKQEYKDLFEFDENRTITMDFDLYCSNKEYLNIISVIYFVASCISGLVFPSLADNFGRKKIMMTSILISGVSVIVLGLSYDINVLIGSLFVTGFFLNGYETICLVYVTEISAKRFRNFSTVTLLCVWAISQLIFAIIYQYLQNWRILVLLLVAFPLILTIIPMNKYLDESPRYLVSNHEYTKATEVLKKISVANNRPPFCFHLLEEIQTFNKKTTHFKTPQQKTKGKQNKSIRTLQDITKNAKGYINLIINSDLRKITILMLYIWFVRYYVYFGIQFSLAQQDDFKWSLIWTSIGEVIGNLIGAPIKLKTKRRSSMSMILIIMTLCSIAINQEFEIGNSLIQKDILIVMIVILKFGIQIYITILITYSSEVYPTSLRAKGYGLCMTVGKIGSVIAPLSMRQNYINNVNPIAYFWICSLGSIICILYLPETQEQQIQEFVYDQNQDDNLQKQIEMIQIQQKQNLANTPGKD